LLLFFRLREVRTDHKRHPESLRHEAHRRRGAGFGDIEEAFRMMKTKEGGIINTLITFK